MDIRKADYCEQFHCLASACPHSCCESWEVVIDPATAAAYRALPGPLGDKLRAALQTEDGEDFFALTDAGRCPFWDQDNLCEIHRHLGEQATSEVCRSHPRFVEDYGTLRETTLCASCPEACRLLLSSTAPLAFPLAHSEETGDPADEWLPLLLAGREKTLEILQNRAQPLGQRLASILLLADEAQTLLDRDGIRQLPALCGAWSMPGPSLPAGAGLFPYGLEVLLGLEILGRDWQALLLRGRGAVSGSYPHELLERIAAYFLFRYYLKSINDGDLLGRVKFALFSTLAVAHLAGCAPLEEALRLYCREIEHSDENIDALLAAFQGDPGLSIAHFCRQLQEI